jgi:hypothetical protein
MLWWTGLVGVGLAVEGEPEGVAVLEVGGGPVAEVVGEGLGVEFGVGLQAERTSAISAATQAR